MVPNVWASQTQAKALIEAPIVAGAGKIAPSVQPDEGVHAALQQSTLQTFSLLPSWVPLKAPGEFCTTSDISIPCSSWAKVASGV